MKFCRAVNLNGSWMRRVAVAGLVMAGGAAGGAQTAPAVVPEPVAKALGWTGLSGTGAYRGQTSFYVSSEPAQWPEALKLTTAWAAEGPKFAERPADYLLRKLARIEALALNANQPGVLEVLKAENREIGEVALVLRSRKASDGGVRVADRLGYLQKALGNWLAETPADRLAVVRDEMLRYRPANRSELVARYGGEARLAELIALGKELNRLTQAFEAAQEDRKTPEPARTEALRKAAGELGYFYGFNAQDNQWQRAINQPDLRAEIAGVAPGNEDGNRRYLNLPDLSGFASEAETEKLLIDAYALPVEVTVPSAVRTAAVVRRLILEGKIVPRHVPWSLLGWRGGELNAETAGELVALHDVLKKQFPELTAKKKDENDWWQKNTIGSWVTALAVAGREADAAELYRKGALSTLVLPYQPRVTPAAGTAVWALALRLADRGSSPVNWGLLTKIARETNRDAELNAFAASQVAAAAPGSETARLWQARQAWLLIGADSVDEGLALLTPLLETRPGANEKVWAAEWTRSVSRLLNLATLLPRPELLETWRQRLAVDFKTPTGLVWNGGTGLFDAYAALELKAGNFKAIEDILRARLALKSESGGDYQLVWMQLADVLARQGRYAEVLALMGESPYYSMKNMEELIRNDQSTRAWRAPVLAVAESMAGVGRKDEAVAILEALLVAKPGYDPAYALYTQVLGDEAAPFLEKIWAADRYEERPLIWLATLQLAAGKTAEAGATARRAIALDPSDVDQPKGDRMRAYAVLRDVELKSGNVKQAEQLAGVVAEIRSAEAADSLVSAGMPERAIKELQAALATRPDGYYLHARLAWFLAQADRMPAALEHYQQALERVPDGIGRAGSRLSNYELTFEGEERQAVAERVLLAMAARADVKPQVYYLLGYLRMEQRRWDEAAEQGFKAVEAEPENLGTWMNLARVLPSSTRPRADRDRVALRLLELEPAGKRFYSPGSSVRDFPALWRAYSEANKVALTVPPRRFEIDEKTGLKKTAATPDTGKLDYRLNNVRPRTPVERLVRHELLGAFFMAGDAIYQWQRNPE